MFYSLKEHTRSVLGQIYVASPLICLWCVGGFLQSEGAPTRSS